MGKKSTKLGVASLIAVGAGIAAVAAKSKKTEEKKRVKEIQKEEHDTFRNTERGKYTKNSKGIYYSNGNYEHLQDLKNLKVLITRVHIL